MSTSAAVLSDVSVLSRTPELVVALDFPKAEQALQLSKQLKGLPVLYKVGLELFLSAGPDLVQELVHQKQRVFLDLKFHDIPHTVAQAVRQAVLLGVEMCTVHLAGGSALFRKIHELFTEMSLQKRPQILGVSVLTSFNELGWTEVTRALTGHPSVILDSVQSLAQEGVSWGMDGMVCSALELPWVRRLFPDLYIVVPGIRPTGLDRGDQMRTVTPHEARQAGASAIVVGRPITRAENPRKVVETLLLEIGALNGNTVIEKST